jgi:hypothetical protein
MGSPFVELVTNPENTPTQTAGHGFAFAGSIWRPCTFNRPFPQKARMRQQPPCGGF